MKISVILAHSKDFSNTGMLSVDLAAQQFFKDNFPDCELVFHVFGLNDESLLLDENLDYSLYREASAGSLHEIYQSDLIVFWSDFYHTKHFLNQFFIPYIADKSSNRKDKIEMFKSFFWLKNAPAKVFEKTIIFGNSMMFLSDDDLKDSEYRDAMYRLYAYSQYAAPRDIISRLNIESKISANSSQGCDPAFILNSKILPKENKMGLFLGRRTKIKITDVIKTMIAAKKLRLKIEWIDWMPNHGSLFKRAKENPEQAINLFLHWALSKIFKPKRPEKCYLEKLSMYSIIVTDTYHLSINALKDDVPVFCIGDNKIIYGRDSKDLHDKKKEVLFDMIGAPHLYGDLSIKKVVDASKFKFSKSKYSKYIKSIASNLYYSCYSILDRGRK